MVHTKYHGLSTMPKNASTCGNITYRFTGGIVRPDKCSWVLIDFEWHNGQYKYKSIQDLPATIQLEDDNDVLQALECIEPTTGVKSLVIYLQVYGSDKDQIKYMVESITSWIQQLNKSFLPANMNLQAMFTRISRTLIYQLSTICLSENDCTHLEAQLYRHSLPRCGISSKLPFAIRYSSLCYMGLMQGTAHLRELLKFYNTPTKIGQQMQVVFEVSQLIIGTRHWIFDYSPEVYGPLLDYCWIKTT